MTVQVFLTDKEQPWKVDLKDTRVCQLNPFYLHPLPKTLGVHHDCPI